MNNQGFDRDKARELIQTFPTLIILFKAGLLTRKLVRDALSIEKWEMDDLYIDLVRAGALRIFSSNTFRGSPEMMALVNQMDAEAREEERERISKGFLGESNGSWQGTIRNK